jgi:hypothetical protein
VLLDNYVAIIDLKLEVTRHIDVGGVPDGLHGPCNIEIEHRYLAMILREFTS